MSASFDDDEDEEEPHMLAVGSGGDSLHDEDDVLDNDEEMMFMHTKEAMGNTTPPPPPPPDVDEEEEEPARLVMPPANTGVDDSFESTYIFESDGNEDFQTRGKNHVIPVINSSPTKKKRPGPDISDNNTDPSTSPQSPSPRSSRGSPGKGDSPQSLRGSPGKSPLGRKSSFGKSSFRMYISPPSSSEYEASPTEADRRAMTQSAFSENDLDAQRRYASPVIQVPPDRSPLSRHQSAPPHTHQSAAHHSASPYRQHSASPYTHQTPNGQRTPPYRHQSAPPYTQQSAVPTIPDGTTPIVLETPKGYRRPSETSKTTRHTSLTPSSSNQNKAFIWGMSKPVFCILAFYILFMTGSFIYFVTQYVQIPSLRDQVEQLSAEVDRLEQQVDELEALIGDLNSTVTELSVVNAGLQVENDRLETQNAVLEEANETFDDQLAGLQEQVDTLQGTVTNLTLANEALTEEAFNLELLNSELTNLTISLNETNAELAATAENLTTINEGLVESNEALTNQTDELQATLNELVLEFDEAYETVVELQDEMESLQEENSRLSNLTESLGTILSFLEETNQDADMTVDQLASQLEEQISNNRVLVLENLQNTLIQRTQTWNCDYINAFSGASFVQDYNTPIESGSYDSVLDYVESRVLTDLCLDRADFELYLSINFMPNGDGLTSNELISGVSMYSSDALNYYFPDSGEAGATPEEWAEASYDCANFPPERQYRTII